MSVDHLSRLQTELREITQPLVDHLAEVNREIVTREEQLKDLRATRQHLRQIVKGIDPSLVAPLYKRNGKPKRQRTDSGTRVSAEKLKALTEFLQERREELSSNGGFRAVDLMDREDFVPLGFGHSTTLNKALAMLHEQSVLHLDRWIRGKDLPHRPTGKFYKVV